ncbi:hypothetical protein [Streptomyces griseocarneus]|uniref:hypothetical protein n=1 Tax=Streptomyces griseocarneus TaxID=51201 RepID=UPI00167EB80D|nr:hypothetical protein [Streptomyces griseocarneus]MBZ6477947.1 hypothetical protein [Streptomyces griseocarneus]
MRDGKQPNDEDLKGFRDALRTRLTVQVADKVQTGPGGTLLLILAGNRFVGRDSVFSQLDDETRKFLSRAAPCEDLCKMSRDAKGDIKGQQLINDKFAGEVDRDIIIGARDGGKAKGDGAGASGPGDTNKAHDTDDSRWLLTVTGGGLLALLAILGVLIVRSSGRNWTPATALPAPAPTGPGPAPRPGAPSPRPAVAPRRRKPVAVPSGPRRSATVRTGLHPQGYVELGRCLRRAAWADPREPAPALGEVVDVFEADGRAGPGPGPGVLLAFPRDAGR